MGIPEKIALWECKALLLSKVSTVFSMLYNYKNIEKCFHLSQSSVL